MENELSQISNWMMAFIILFVFTLFFHKLIYALFKDAIIPFFKKLFNIKIFTNVHKIILIHYTILIWILIIFFPYVGTTYCTTYHWIYYQCTLN